MKLKIYLSENNLTQMQFIKKVKEKTGERIPQGTLAKWVLESRIPRKNDMALLITTTKGKVMPNDFYI